ncbi:hypothetical protein [Butyrivibrio sp. YAB3001]|uniref:hypothetical protein n=1 Tax=Butyrivibrio sp. YAB3001 TaxID=1520812 RepID=UPI0008F621C8|nr:hypothetical protein [Butyrivibrio sp. YAB3001]SFC26535.1 hypothetical protein SAMN02910398_01844 [Butyrivibrio sp. YAB3001]
MKKYIKRLVCVLAVIAIIVVGIYKMGWLVRPVKTDICINAINTFHEIPDNSIEVMGYGSSHMWRGMNPMELYSKYGIGAYNYGCNWQKLNTTLLFFKDSLKTQKPKVALIETFMVGECLEDINVNGEIYYTSAIDNDDNKEIYLKQCLGDDKERYLSYYIPFVAFHDNWNDLQKSSFNPMNNYDGKDFRKTMGFVSSDTAKKAKIPDYTTFEQEELSETSVAILDDIMMTCRANDIKVVFYTAPYQGEYKYANAMKDYAEQNGCAYFNLFEYVDEIGIDGKTDFSDKGHLNTSGSNKVADFLGKYLKETFELTDFRNIKGNMWENEL